MTLFFVLLLHDRFLTGNMQLHHVSLDLVYLHSWHIFHGDLKAVNIYAWVDHWLFLTNILQLNILIDGSGKAVLCDFGLSRIKADATSRTAVQSDGGSIIGSRNWMAPEQLLGRPLKKPCD